MTKVLCINDRNSIGEKCTSYTKGKWYEVVSDSTNTHMFYIKSDDGTNPAVLRQNFISLEEIRNNKLKEIGI